MYSTCLFCHASLGTNEVVEHFPVGRRLAFDVARGRLWVVCRRCERWNLTPIEERWEAIEECEKLFRSTTLRMSTEHIGLARVREGLEIVRIGSPQRPEMAAWRYGDQFGRRRLRYWGYGAAGALALGALIAGGVEVGLIAGGGFNIVFNAINVGRNAIWSRRTVAYVPTPNGSVRVQRGHLPSARITRSNAGEMVLQFDRTRFAGEPSTRLPIRDTGLIRRRGGLLALTGRRIEIPLEQSAPALAALLPAINAKGGTRQTVSRAVGLLDEQGTDGLLRSAAEATPVVWNAPRAGQLNRLPAELRLALEMATHEDQERAALEGELAALEERWREAEEIAGIADDLFVAPSVTDSLDQIKRAAERDPGGNSTPPSGTNQ
jgi:hypothetical protein